MGICYSGLQENMHIVCDVPPFRSGASLGEVLHENLSNLDFDPQYLGFWVVMNIINSISRGGSPCVLVPPSLAPEEQMHAVGKEFTE